MSVRVRPDTDRVDLGSTVQERPEESGRVGERSPGFGVATDAEDRPDAQFVDPPGDALDVLLVLHHPGGEVWNDGEALTAVVGAEVERVVDGLGR